MFVGVTGFALVMPVLATSAVSDTANGNRNERFFMSHSGGGSRTGYDVTYLDLHDRSPARAIDYFPVGRNHAARNQRDE
jgi:hypothetical protein